VQASPSSAQLAGQVEGGSQVSPACTTASPHCDAQSASVSGVQPAGQQRSPPPQVVIAACEHTRSQLSRVPLAKSSVHGSSSAHEAGQAPTWPAEIARSQVSVTSTRPFPHCGPQSLSFAAVQPAPEGQHPSPEAQVVMGWRRQGKEQADVDGSVTNGEQLSPPGQLGAQDGEEVAVSQVSQGTSTTPLPQMAAQSESMPACAPGGQQPSPLRMVVVGTKEHRAVQLPASIRMSSVQGTPSEQLLAQLPGPSAMATSHCSPGSRIPSPQVAGQSGSDAASQPLGQQPSAAAEHPSTGSATQLTEQLSRAPMAR